MDTQALVKLLDNFSMERNTLEHTLGETLAHLVGFFDVFKHFLKIQFLQLQITLAD